MSEASKELASIVHFGAVIESLGPLAQLKVDGSAAKIDAAVAPLVELAEAAVAYINENPCDPDIYPEQWAAWQRYQKALEAKALDPWRK